MPPSWVTWNAQLQAVQNSLPPDNPDPCRGGVSAHNNMIDDNNRPRRQRVRTEKGQLFSQH
jgi:hypothetical protein